MVRVAMVVGEYPPAELALRREKILSYSQPDLEVGVILATPTAYQKGFDGERAKSAVPFFVDAFKRAEAEGYHAVIPLGVLDIGVEEGRRAVDIPVVGALEATLHVASLLGRSAGLIAYTENLIPTYSALVAKYGFQQHVGGYAHVDTNIVDLSSEHDRLHAKFVAAARQLQDNNAVDVIVSAGISLCPVHLDRRDLERDLGLPVVEAFGAPIHIAATLARMRVRHSRTAWPRSLNEQPRRP